MYHVHSSSLSSSTSTTEAVSSLPPHVLFPFFQPPPPSSPSTSSSSHTRTTTTSSNSTSPPSAFAPGCPSCPTSAGGGGEAFPALPYPVTPNFIRLPSSNSAQSILLPLPTPSTLFPPQAAVPSAAPSQQSASHATPPSASTSAPSSTSGPSSAPASTPLLVFSHGSTAVDTYIPASRVLQRTLYTWSQLSDYTTMHCWHLPSASTSSASSPTPSSLSFTNGSGRLCSETELHKCPGHPWVNYSYHMQVKQWQEQRDGEPPNLHTAHQSTHAPQANPACHPVPADSCGGGGDGLQRREAGWLDAMGGKVPEVRVISPAEVFSGRRRGMEEDGEAVSEGSEAEGERWDDDDWDDLCTTEGEDDEDDEDLTDVDM